MPTKQEYTDNQGLSEVWTKFETLLTDHWLLILLLIVTAFIWRWVTTPRKVPSATAGKTELRVNLKLSIPTIFATSVAWIIYFTDGLEGVGLPKIDNWLWPIIALVCLLPLVFLGYKALLPRKWMVNFVQSAPTAHPRMYWPSFLSFMMIVIGIVGAALVHHWISYLAAAVLVIGGYYLSLHINIPIRQAFMLTWFGRPLYPVFPDNATDQQRQAATGSRLIPNPGRNTVDHNKVLMVGLKRLRGVPVWFSPLDFVPLAYVKRENKVATDWLECMAIPEVDNNGQDEGVAAGPSFKINYREAHRLNPNYIDVFWGLDDNERNNIDEYIIGVINDWLADYMHTQTPDKILDSDFLREMSDEQIARLVVRRPAHVSVEDHGARIADLRIIQEDIKELRLYILKSTGYDLLEIGMRRREPDASYKEQLDEYASKRAEEKTALRDINVQTAQGRAFMARLTAMTTAINESLEAMGKSGDELVTVNDVWDQIIEDQRSRRAASHVVGTGQIAGLLSSLARRK